MRLGVGIAVLLIAGCADPVFEPTMAGVQRHVFDRYCSEAACHGRAPESGLRLTGDGVRNSLLERTATGVPGERLIQPLQPDASYLLRKLGDVGIVGERMPLGRSPLPDSAIALVRAWIERGAPP